MTSRNVRKVVFVNRYFSPDESATAQLLTDLAVHLVEAGGNVHIICSRQRYEDAAADLPAREVLSGVEVHRVWSTRFGRKSLPGRSLDYLTFYLFSWFKMLALLRKNDVIVAKTDPPLLSVPALIAAKLKRAELVNWLQDVFPEVASALGANPLPPLLDAALRALRNVSLRAARRNVVLGERMRELILACKVSPERVEVIANWAEVRPMPPKEPSQSVLRLEAGLMGKFVVGYSGNLGRAHDFQTMLDAAVILQSDAQIVFLMVGGGAGTETLRHRVKTLGLENFRFLPYQPRAALSDCLAAADVHWVSLQPALEGCIVPSKFYGILAAARPVLFVGDRDGELSREIARSQCGASADVGDGEGVAKLLSGWKSEQAVCRRMGEAGYQRYQKHFAAEHAFARWQVILNPGRRAGLAAPR